MYELPNSKIYALVSFENDLYGSEYGKMSLIIRNPENGTFRSDFELHSTFHFSNTFEYAYGGELVADAYTFNLRNLESAAKILKKTFKSLEKLNSTYGYTDKPVDVFIRILKAMKIDEVRVVNPNEQMNGWNILKPMSVKTDLDEIRMAIRKVEHYGLNRYSKKVE